MLFEEHESCEKGELQKAKFKYVTIIINCVRIKIKINSLRYNASIKLYTNQWRCYQAVQVLFCNTQPQLSYLNRSIFF